MSNEKPSARDDQIADLAYFINNRKAGLLHDPGVGKTVTAALYTEYCIKYLNEKVVWTQPLSILKKNRDEILKFTDLAPEDVVIVQGTPEKRKKLMQGPGKVFLFSATGWSSEWQILLESHPTVKVSIHDECHLYYAGHKSKRTQAWYMVSRHMNSVIPMSGTIIKGKLSTIYPVMHVIAPQYYGSYESFMAQHAVLDEYGSVIGWQNHEKVRNVLGATSIRRSFESIYGNQDPVIQIEECEMTPSIRRSYDELEATAILELEDKFLEAGTPGVMAIRCRQIMAHPETFGLGKKGELTGKDEQMMLYVNNALETGEPLVIFAALQPEQERIKRLIEEAGGRVGLINGSVPGPKRQQIDVDFREKRLQFIVGSSATCGIGFNWQFVDLILFTSLDYGDDTFTQAFKRGIRGKRTKPLLVKVLQYKRSIDQRIMQIVQKKMADYHQVDETKAEVFKDAMKTVKPTVNKSGLTMEDII